MLLAIKDQDPPESHPAVRQYMRMEDAGQVQVNPWSAATDHHRQVASSREIVCMEVQALLSQCSLNKAIELTLDSQKNVVKTALHVLKHPKKGSVRNWHIAYRDEGKNALLPNHTGTNRKAYGWETKFLQLYHRPQNPALRKVARDLREKFGFRTATEHNVRYFFSLLPSNLQSKSPWRMGQKQYKDGLREHIKRTTENLPVGFLYQGDGHQIDTYIQHPKSGHLAWRPELVLFMDVKSRYIVGWYLSVAESSINTMAAMSHALGTHNHVPAMVYVDNGSGFRSNMMNSDTIGFYSKFDMEPIFALPGNAKAKNIERWFRTMEDDYGKDLDTYCGYGMSKDAKRNLTNNKLRKLKQDGKIKVLTLQEWTEGFEDFVNRYHHRPHPEYPDTTPAKMWAELEPVPVHDMNLLVKPRETVKVVRDLVTLHKRTYRSDFFHQYEGRELVAEYDLHDDSMIRLFDDKGTWLCNGELKSRADYIPTSRIEEAEHKRTQAAIKRLNNKASEIAARGSLPQQQTEQAQDAQTFDDALSALESHKAPANDNQDMDLTDVTLDDTFHERSDSELFDMDDIINQ